MNTIADLAQAIAPALLKCPNCNVLPFLFKANNNYPLNGTVWIACTDCNLRTVDTLFIEAPFNTQDLSPLITIWNQGVMRWKK